MKVPEKAHLDTHLSAEEVLGQLWALLFSLSMSLCGGRRECCRSSMWRSKANLVKMVLSLHPVSGLAGD